MDDAGCSGVKDDAAAVLSEHPSNRGNTFDQHCGISDDDAEQSPEVCTICLQPVSERAVAAPCNHLTFDFVCLVSWLWQKPTCPLCKTRITRVEYDWRSPDDFKTFIIPHEIAETTIANDNPRSRERRAAAVPRRRRLSRPPRPVIHEPAVLRRREIYRHRLYAQHIGSSAHSAYQDFTAQDFAASATLQSRARQFLRRELQVFSFLDDHVVALSRGSSQVNGRDPPSMHSRQRQRPANREYIMEYIVFVLRSFDVKGADGTAQRLVAEYLGHENATQILHELAAWLRSSHRELREWDREVQYADQSLAGK